MSASMKMSDSRGKGRFRRFYVTRDKEFYLKKESQNKKKLDDEKLEILNLEQKIAEDLDTSVIQRFADFPLSHKTLAGLKAGSFFKPTEIQKESLLFSLRGLDILGAAKTGSGKTLAFIIPVLERLYRSEWNHLDGLGALVVTPVRELAYQIFEVLQKVGLKHDFSAGLIIGGREVDFEKNRLNKCNVIICTPGRLLQHMDENPLFDASNLKILILDEADRILDMGFRTALNAVIENLPKERQTMLFSATQTKSVKDLARLSLRDPVYVSVHEHSKYSTPETLKQSYVVCELHEKISLLWSFVKYHLKQKILVFLSSCKEVRFVHQLFSRLHPGMNVMALFGTMKQPMRTSIYNEFCSKTSAVLIATDLAARGLDFPSVNWVLQADCPEDANEYIHRVGRTARCEKDGESLLILLPSEEMAMVAELTTKKIPISKIKINPKNQQSIQIKLEGLLARDVTFKNCAQGAFVSYLKSVFLMKNKKVFDVTKLDTAAYARSLGLAVPPRVRFLQKKGIILDRSSTHEKEGETTERNLDSDKQSTSSSVQRNENSKKYVEQSYNFSTGVDSDEELFQVRRRIMPDDEIELPAPEMYSKNPAKVLTKEAIARKIMKKNIRPNVKFVFDEDGQVVEDRPMRQLSEVAREILDDDVGGIDIEKAKAIMQEEDKIDKKMYSEKVKAKHKEKKLKERNVKRPVKEESQEEDEGIQLGGNDDDSDGGSLDLNFLPDPDKFYGKKDSESDEDGKDTTGENKKRKRKMKAEKKTKKSRSRMEVDEGLDTGLQLADDEELALHLLNMK